MTHWCQPVDGVSCGVETPGGLGYSTPGERMADAPGIPSTTWLSPLELALQYRHRTLELLRRTSAQHGPVVLHRTGLAPPLVSLFGPDANRFVLLDQEQQLSAKRAWDFIMGRIFPNGLLLRDGADHRHHRRGYTLPEQQAPIAKPTDGLPITLARLT